MPFKMMQGLQLCLAGEEEGETSSGAEARIRHAEVWQYLSPFLRLTSIAPDPSPPHATAPLPSYRRTQQVWKRTSMFSRLQTGVS